MTLVFKGGTVVTPRGARRADVAVTGDTIAAIEPVIDATGTVVDASGLLLLPGMVDTHVHLMDPGPIEREDFPTGTRAAAARGATTIIEHTHAHPVRSADDLRAKVGHLHGRSNVDYGLAAHVWPEDLDHLVTTWEAGVSFFKMFTCTTHGVPGLGPVEVREAFQRIASFGGRALVHCEDEALTGRAEQVLRRQGRDDPAVLIDWRSREAEEVAVAVVGVLAAATGVRATIAHVSTPAVAELVGILRDRGADLAAEACPQYFAIGEEEVVRHRAFRKFTPPARIRSNEDREAMWAAVVEGRFSHFSTDHAPSTAEQKGAGDIWSAPFGLPGLDTTFPFLIDAALTGRIGLDDLARLTAEAPARRYGLHPRKGALDPGADADIVLVDPSSEWRIDDDDILSKAGWSPYSGQKWRGRVTATYLRGRLVAENGRPLDGREGRFLPGPGATE